MYVHSYVQQIEESTPTCQKLPRIETSTPRCNETPRSRVKPAKLLDHSFDKADDSLLNSSRMTEASDRSRSFLSSFCAEDVLILNI